MKPLFVALVLVAGGLVATTPGMEAVQAFVRTQAADRIEREVEAGALGALLGGAGSSSRTTHRRSRSGGRTWAPAFTRWIRTGTETPTAGSSGWPVSSS
ncbi:hypothetical protein GGQ19_000631 [Salinibacter ruber]|nr:hypothetical protein [Salinibacter ruber]